MWDELYAFTVGVGMEAGREEKQSISTFPSTAAPDCWTAF